MEEKIRLGYYSDRSTEYDGFLVELTEKAFNERFNLFLKGQDYQKAKTEYILHGCNMYEYQLRSLYVPKFSITNEIYSRAFAIVAYDEGYYEEDNPYIQHAEIADGYTKLGGSAFAKCVTLRDVRLPSTLLEIGYECFIDCEKLEEISIPDSVTNIGTSCFSRCKSLKTAKLSSRLTCIPDFLFYQCSSLRSIRIPDVVETIEKYAFAESGLKNITIGERTERIGDRAFYNTKLKTIILPRSVVEISENAFENVDKNCLTLYCYPGSYGLIYAREHGLNVKSAEI